MPSEVAALRGAVARIEAGRSGAAAPRPARLAGPGGAAGPPAVSFGEGEGGGGSPLPLDAALGGGLRRGALHEVVAEDPRDAAAAAGFALAAAGRCAGPAPLVWIVEDRAAAETGLPYRPGLAAHGIDPDRLILVRTADGRATLWALEEALRLGAPAVLAELWNAKPYGLAPSRRLLLAAQGGRGLALLLHAGLAGRGAALSSAAETRLAVGACPSPRAASAGGRAPIPGGAAVAVRVLKLRIGGGGAGSAGSAGSAGDAGAPDLDRDRRHTLVWNQRRRCFDAHTDSSLAFPVASHAHPGVDALPVGLPAPAADGPRPARRSADVVAFRSGT